jgi:WW domain-containing oxidoreductase
MSIISPPAIPFGAHSTADEVLAGLDLTGRTILVTGCTSGIGFETLRALAQHGAHVLAVARTLSKAREACAQVGGTTMPIACDLSDLASVRAAAETVRALGRPLDAIVANAGLIGGGKPELLYGVEKQFLVNHVAHFLLVNELIDLVPDRTGRIVVVSSSASIQFAPKQGILFDDLDGARGYKRFTFYGHSKLANALFARELARRLEPRGITANAVHPGVILTTRFLRDMAWIAVPLRVVARRFTKTLAEGAATQTLVAASPLAAGVTGRYWSDCKVAQGSAHMDDPVMAGRLWQVSEEIAVRTTR